MSQHIFCYDILNTFVQVQGPYSQSLLSKLFPDQKITADIFLMIYITKHYFLLYIRHNSYSLESITISFNIKYVLLMKNFETHNVFSVKIAVLALRIR